MPNSENSVMLGAFINEATAAVDTTKQKLWEAEVYRTAGEIALISPEPDAAKAEAYFERALAVAHQQQAKSWELRAAMSLAASGATKASRSKRANCLLRFTAGSLKDSTRAT
jgi:predicted ATPase